MMIKCAKHTIEIAFKKLPLPNLRIFGFEYKFSCGLYDIVHAPNQTCSYILCSIKSDKKIAEVAELKLLTEDIIKSYQKRFYFADELRLIMKNLTENYHYPTVDRTLKPILQLVIPHNKETIGLDSY